jgi:putative cell wall-binding protein
MGRDAILHTYLDPGLTVADVERLAGPGRIETAVAISQAAHAPGAPVAFVTTARDFPDALAAGPAAAIGHGPILLVEPDSLPAAVAAELVRLAPPRVVVLGGAGAVSESVKASIAALPFAPVVDRIEGVDRYATAVAVSASTFDGPVPVAYVATGRDFPDALAGSAAGASVGGPVLLVPGDVVPNAVIAELTRLAPVSIRVLGGPAAVSDQAVATLAGLFPDVVRLAGPDRYATAAAVSAATYGPDVERLLVATGVAFPDALAGAALGGPLSLVSAAPLGASVVAELARLSPTRLVVLGGTGAVSDASVTRVVAAASGP